MKGKPLILSNSSCFASHRTGTVGVVLHTFAELSSTSNVTKELAVLAEDISSGNLAGVTVEPSSYKAVYSGTFD